MSWASLTVGEPWPYPGLAEGLRALDAPASDGLDLTLVAAIPAPSPAEVQALTRGPLRLALAPAGALVMIAALADRIDLDAPYAPGVEGGHGLAAVAAAAGRARGWPAETRRLLTLATVDLETRQVRGLRTASLSRAWWIALADAIDQARSVTAAERDLLMAGVYARYPKVQDLLAGAVIVEQAGAV